MNTMIHQHRPISMIVKNIFSASGITIRRNSIAVDKRSVWQKIVLHIARDSLVTPILTIQKIKLDNSTKNDTSLKLKEQFNA